MSYRVNEIFYSLQGEGARAGAASLFVRFSGCNQTCKVESHGFDCDTEFMSGREMTAEEIGSACVEAMDDPDLRAPVIFTGGEPLLQLDLPLLEYLASLGYTLPMLETNGSLPIPEDMKPWLAYVSCSPKVAEHAVRLERADELRYVRAHGQGIPRPSCAAGRKYLSPAAIGDEIDPRSLAWCIELARSNPEWRLSVQQHKFWRVR